jgi:hypothetical protein
LRVEWDVSDLVDDQQRDALQAGELVVESALALGVGEQRDRFGGGAERDALAGEAGADPDRDRQVTLAGPGRVGVELLMLLIRCRRACGWWRRRASCAASSLRFWAGGPGLGS